MKRNTFFKNHLAGFTLTELMAVSIIVAILAGLATGTYRKAIERSRVTEGHVAAKTLASALDRYYIENPTASDRTFPTKISSLDIGFENSKSCSPADARCIRTRYFQLKIKQSSGNTYIEADRINSNSVTMGYHLEAYPTMFGGKQQVDPRCFYSTEKGKDLCISFGYDCSASSSNTNGCPKL